MENLSHSSSQPETIAILGGGFSGSLTAVNLIRLAPYPLRVVLINHGHPMGRGVAYGTQRGEHILNVAARNMSAFPDHPDHFKDWLRTRVEFADLPEPQLREMFVPRRVYGDYIRGLLFQHLHTLDERFPARLECMEDEAVDVNPLPDGRAEIRLADREPLVADRVLLATGNPAPAPLPGTPDLAGHSAYAADPWGDWMDRMPESATELVVLGTGLSMVDVFLSLSEKGWPGRITAISRNGKLPQSHFRGIEYPDFLPEHPEELGLAALGKLVEDHCERLRRLGANPGIVVDRLRPHTQRIWQNFSIEEKRLFLRNHAPAWNVVRHRIAQPVHQLLTEALTEGRLRVVRGTIEQVEAGPEQGIGVRVRTRHGTTELVGGDFAVNCTGPGSIFATPARPLIPNLRQRGLVRPDELEMGLDVGPDFSVIEADGRSSGFLYTIGPLMKGSLWETTAVPELRGQARRVAEVLLGEALLLPGEQDFRMAREEAHVIEYYI